MELGWHLITSLIPLISSNYFRALASPVKPIQALCACLLLACSIASAQQSPLAILGVLDLREMDLGNAEPIPLSGEWEFYWQQLLDPEQIATEPPESSFQIVPTVWTRYGDDFTVQGYATFRLQVLLPEGLDALGLFFDGQGSSTRLWVNGELLAEDGDVGSEPGDKVRNGYPQTLFFSVTDSYVEFVVQIANYSHRNAGFRNALLLGSPEAIASYYQTDTTFEWVYLSLLLAIALYHYFLFYQRRNERFSFHFANLCVLTALRIGFTGNNVLVAAMPFISWEAALRIEYLTFFFVAPVFTLMMRSIYPREVHRWFVQTTFVVAGIYSLYTLVVSTLAATYVVPSYQVVLLFEMSYFAYFLVSLFRFRREGRYYITAATVVGLLGLISEILYFRGLVPIGGTAPFGMVGFVLVQAIFMAARFSASFRRVEELSSKLEQNIRDLEESETKYRTIFEDSKDVIFIADLSGKIEEISPACESLFGLTPEEVKASEINLYTISKKEDRSRFARLIDEEGSVQDFEFELLQRDGSIIRAVMNASTRVDRKGNIIGIQGAVRDISDKVLAEEQRQRADELELIASTDPLTGAHTRRYFDDVASRELARSTRNRTPLSLVIFDIDHFKQINDKHGHLAGDRVLMTLANLCRENIRSTDVFCRFGGEEFIILMPETELESAFQKTEALRERVGHDPLVNFNGVDIPVTFSAGVALWDGKETIEALIGRGDKALYRAKRAGRNRTLVAES